MDTQPAILPPNAGRDTMKKILAGIAAAAILAVPIVLSMGTSVPLDELRLARLSECPPEETAQEDCPAGMFDKGAFCICMTNKESVDNEVTSPPIPNRMVVCETVEAGTTSLQVRTESVVGPVGNGCVLVASGILLPGVSFHNIETGVESQLRARCTPCIITADSWGPCPYCLHPSYGKTCAEACPVEEE